MGNGWSEGNTEYNSVKIQVNNTSTSINDGYWYCNAAGSHCNYFCGKAWQANGKLNGAVALFGDDNCDDVDGITVYKGNNAKTSVKKLMPGDMMVISQVGPLKNVKPWVVTDKASITGAFYHFNAVVDDNVGNEEHEQFWFIDKFVYYFDEAGYVTIAFTGSAGETMVYETLESVNAAKASIL